MKCYHKDMGTDIEAKNNMSPHQRGGRHNKLATTNIKTKKLHPVFNTMRIGMFNTNTHS